ncbi:MAG: hypothetical protein JW763_02740 [candidate division Zixibacteria bacterium]|nr:hypothetical protein [candidate division Zixibacteria bacterium]
MTMRHIPIGGGNAPIKPGRDTMRRFSSLIRALTGVIVIVALIAILILISMSIADSHARTWHDSPQMTIVGGLV